MLSTNYPDNCLCINNIPCDIEEEAKTKVTEVIHTTTFLLTTAPSTILETTTNDYPITIN